MTQICSCFLTQRLVPVTRMRLKTPLSEKKTVTVSFGHIIIITRVAKILVRFNQVGLES